jgi:hypothetical protein
MPRVPFPGRAGRDEDDPLLDLILDRQPLPASAPAGLLALADSFDGLATPPGTGEMPGQAAALAAFRRASWPASTRPTAAGSPGHRRRIRLRAGRARLSAAVAAVIMALSGTAVAGYAGALPASLQSFAHRMIGAPAPQHAAHHAHGAAEPRAGHPGSQPSPTHATSPAHRAKPGKKKAIYGRGHRSQTGKHAKKPKRAHPARPQPKAHPSRTPGPPER